MKTMDLALLLLGWLCYIGIGSAESQSQCEPSQFSCNTGGRCINLSWKCDGDDDCHDNSDEIGCPETTCSDSDFQCGNGKCVPLRWTCDDVDDCKDSVGENGSDEEGCLSKNCSSGEFQCSKSGLCIPNNLKCDLTSDCPDGEDEEDCKALCDKDEFLCADNKCISNAWKCDHHDDCTDGSDEKNCPVSECTSIGEKRCEDGECINDSWWCDGDGDCKDESDEKNCTSEAQLETCSASQYRCTTPILTSECINESWKCDGEPDCTDGSDERDCPEHTCKPGERKCDTMYCIKEIYFCDGEPDCEDKSDEIGCNNTEVASNCETWQFDCNGDGTQCISVELLCNEAADCLGGEDESKDTCPVNNLCKHDNGGCSQICEATGATRVCKCNSGFQLVGETQCEDINECELPGTCSQVCTNDKGAYKCGCYSGYSLTNGHFCRATGGERPELILSVSDELRRYHLDTFHYSKLVDEEVTGAAALDFDKRDNTIYWSDTERKKIFSVNLQTKEKKTILENLDHPDGLAVDWVHKNLYIADTERKVIEVSSIDGAYRMTIASHSLDNPRALALDPQRGWIYWTDWGVDAKIEKCGMNGKGRKVIVNTNIIWPNGVTIDYTNKRLYWVDAKLHHIGSSDLDGGDQKVIVKDFSKLSHPFAITVFEDFLYYTDWSMDAIYKTSKFHQHRPTVGSNSSEIITKFALNLKSPMDIHVFHVFRQPLPKEINYPCGNNRGGCSHLCLPMPAYGDTVAKIECACPDGMKLTTTNNAICENVTADHTTTLQPIEKITSTSATTVKPTAEQPAGNVDPATEKPEASSQPDVNPQVTSEPPSVNITHQNLGSQGSEEEGTGVVAGITIAVVSIIAILAGVVVFVLVRRYKKNNMKSMNFDNPVYRKTTTTDDDQLMLKRESATSDQMEPLNHDPEIV